MPSFASKLRVRRLVSPRKEGGFPLYLSGGGFRGWGYLLLYLHQVRRQYYPISIINGFSAPKEDFEDTEVLKKVAQTARDIFRVSDRRREQVPSVAFLINVLAEAVPYGIKEAHFCQGGVRKGILFRDIPPFVRQQDPLEVATTAFARPSAQMIAYLMFGAIPKPTEERTFPASIRGTMIQAFANALFVHAAMSKELPSTAALYSTSAGLLAHAVEVRTGAGYSQDSQGRQEEELDWGERWLGDEGQGSCSRGDALISFCGIFLSQCQS